MVLVQDGLFYYPARILSEINQGSCSVRWWRHNHPAGKEWKTMHVPGAVARVHVRNIVDDLWLDVAGRRQIRVSTKQIYRTFSFY